MTEQDPERPCRPATAADASSIGHLIVATWRHAYADLVPKTYLEKLDPAAIAARWAKSTDAPCDFRRVVTVDGKVVGACSGGLVRETDPLPNVAELYSINVHPEYWGQGVGAALLRCAVSAMTDSNCQGGILWVLASNERARRFYAQAGWHTDGEERTTSRLTGTPLHELRYCLTL